ncbi:hypothetical protein NQ317_015638 [Molorchus minor]|uniref:CCHC-type domain-containing protein n=1 Tax=Molorchus minor TaxID=1323400 RepID=A0ABQ9JT52_9CUCU|nr:hypothetical protein NQ317_015638 [Molorchus minor]
MDMMKEMKRGQDEMKQGQDAIKEEMKDAIKEEMKQGQDAIKEEMKQGQDAIKEEMKDAIKEEMKQCQDEMKSAQEAMKNEVTRQLQDQGNKIDQQVSEILTNMKTEMHTRFEYMEKVVEETVEEFKNEVDKEITDMKKDFEVLINNKIDNGLVDVKKEIDILKRKCEFQKFGTTNVEEGYHHSSKIKPPTYDGKTSWQTYMKQFDAAANVNNWSESKKATALIVSLRGDALEILQTLNEDQHKNYEDLVLQLEMRFGDKHLQQVYQAQLKGRNQRINENLQQYEADIARLVYLAYPTAPRDFIEQLAVQVFIDGIRDCETQQALRLARCKKLNEVLAYALEFEAAKQASRGHTRIRQIRTRTPEREYRSNSIYNRSNFKDDVENLRQKIKDIQTSLENIVEQADRRNQATSFRRRIPLECWNCGEKGHIRPCCPKVNSSCSMTSQGPGKRQLSSFPGQKLTRFYQAPLSKIKVSRLRNDGTSLVAYGKVCGRECRMVIDTGSYHTIVKPNILAHCRMKQSTNNLVLETAGGETLPVIGVHEAEFQLGGTVFHHEVFVANIRDDVLMGLELMEKHGFKLNLQERLIKIGQDEIIMPRSDETVSSHCRRTAVVNGDNWETKKLREEQQNDVDIKPFIAWKEEGTRPEWKDISNKSTTLKGYWAIWDSLIVENGILKRLWENTDGKEIRKQIVLPRARVNEVLQEVHGGVGGGVEPMSKIGVDGVLSVPVAKDQEPEAEGK